MQAPANCQGTSVKPQGNFEPAPELMDASEKRPLDVVYEYFVGRRESEEDGLINVRGQLLRGMTQPHSQVSLSCVGPSCELVVQLTFAPADAKALANLIQQAAADAEAAATVKQGGAA